MTSRNVAYIIWPILAWTWQEGDQRQVSVCDVLANLAFFNGKEVSVRGVWRAGPHGQWIEASDVCNRKLVTEKLTWPDKIHLTEDHASKLDFLSLAKMQIQMKQFDGKKGEFDVVVTYLGVLSARVPLQVAHYPEGTLAPHGFGHMNYFPAELRYRAVRDIKIRPHQSVQPMLKKQ